MTDDDVDHDILGFLNVRLEEFEKAKREGAIDKTFLAAHGCSKDHRAQPAFPK